MKIKLSQINLPNIRGFIQGNFRKVLEDFGQLPDYLVEQAKWRLDRVKKVSPKCYEQDKCIYCSCQVSAKVFEDRGCEYECYPEMMNEEAWELYKIKN